LQKCNIHFPQDGLWRKMSSRGDARPTRRYRAHCATISA
jgi:hypothetical protein